jgi:hypothetical protein
MFDSLPPTFDQWVTYCFTQGYHDVVGDFSGDREARHARFLMADFELLTAYLTQLFESPSFIAERFTDKQIAEATWFIFGSGCICNMCDAAVPPSRQIRCVRSITTFYTDLLDRVCGRHGEDPDSDLRDIVELDGAVYMMWDMNFLAGLITLPEKGPHLVEPAIEILDNVLRRCRTSACRVSALHGIGHVYDPGRDKAIAARLREIVDAFTDRETLPEWLNDYAAGARRGAVQ